MASWTTCFWLVKFPVILELNFFSCSSSFVSWAIIRSLSTIKDSRLMIYSSFYLSDDLNYSVFSTKSSKIYSFYVNFYSVCFVFWISVWNHLFSDSTHVNVFINSSLLFSICYFSDATSSYFYTRSPYLSLEG